MRVAIYGRVSTAEQNAAMRLDELRAYCQRQQWQIAEEFTDSGISGSRESRPALNRLLYDAKRRKFDAVLVYRMTADLERVRKYKQENYRKGRGRKPKPKR